EAYLRWMSALLSTMYPPTTSESSDGDSFSEDSISPEDSVEEDIDTYVLEDIKADATTIEKASLLEHVASLERSNARIRDTMMMERARADRFRRHMRFIESELRQIRRFRYYDMMRFRRLETFANMTITRFGMTPKAIEELVNRRMEEALAAYEATLAANALEAENQSQKGSDGNNGNRGNGNDENGNSENGNGNQMRIIGMLGLLLESVRTKIS
nr:hypothetical protein [Tanacetum cinerariifolium]